MRLSRQDVRLAVRSFSRHRTFTAVAVLSLALAISLNTTMYSVIDAMVNPKTDVRDPDRMFSLILWGDAKHKVDDATRASMLRAGPSFFESIASSQGYPGMFAVASGRRYDQVRAAFVSPNYFEVLGVHPLAGRTFSHTDRASGAEPVMISERLAATLFAGGESPAGAAIDIDGTKHAVIGVVSKSLSDGTDLWTLPPPAMSLASLPVNVVRLRAGVSKREAEQILTVLSTRIAHLAREAPKDVRFELAPWSSRQFQYQKFHYALIGAVVAVLLIACANLANLQLARGIRRSRELAVRAALGASRRDIVAQLLLESAVLAGAGLVVGLLLTFWATHLLESRIPPSVADYVIAPQTSWRVLAFALVACVVCVLLVGLVPAIRVSRVDPNVLLKAGAGTGANKQNRRQYGVLVVAEIGLSLVLLSGAAIVARTALEYRQIQIGYDVKALTQTNVYNRAMADTSVPFATLANNVLSSVRALPGVADATLYQMRSPVKHAITIVDPSGASIEVTMMTSYNLVTPSYFRTLGLPILKGRGFLDGVPSAPEVVVDYATARSLWPNSNPVGALIKLGEFNSMAPWVRVVGVAGMTLAWKSIFHPLPPPKPRGFVGAIYYLPVGSENARLGARGPYFVITRSTADPERMPNTMVRAMRRIEPSAVVYSGSMEGALGILSERQRHDFVASTFIVFAVMAVGLAALGIYGIVAHAVAERTRELGVRIALGASARNVVSVILREGLVVVLAGVAVGLYLTKTSVIWLHAFSREGDEYDAPLFAAMALALLIVAIVSALIPALRATRIDPVESLRSE